MRRKRRNRVLILAFFIFVALIIALESPLTRIRTISVTGNKSVTTNHLIVESSLKKGMSLWQINSSAVQRAIERKEPVVEGVNVQTDYLSGHVTLHVTQKNVVAIFVQNGKFYNLLNDGTVYNQINGNSGFQVPIITSTQHQSLTVGKPVPDAFLAKLCKQMGNVTKQDLAPISEINVDKLGTATLYLTNGFEVKLSIAQFAVTMPKVQTAVAYFTNQGYKPGMLDMSGQPPYMYASLQSSSSKTGKGKSK